MTTKLHGSEITKTKEAIYRLDLSDSTSIGVPNVTLRKEKDYEGSRTEYIRLYIGNECMYSQTTDYPFEAIALEITYVWTQYNMFLGSITSKQIARQGLHK